MALDATKVRVALTGHIYFQPEGDTPLEDPTDLSAPAGAIDLGYTTEDGVTFTFGRDVEEIMGWQSMDPLRKLVTAEPKTAAFTLRQLERDTWLSTMGGKITELAAANVETGAGAINRWEPVVGEIPTGRILIDMDDLGILYRFGFRRAQNTAEIEFSLVRNDALNLPNEWSAVATKDGKPAFFMDTNDPAFAAA